MFKILLFYCVVGSALIAAPSAIFADDLPIVDVTKAKKEYLAYYNVSKNEVYGVIGLIGKGAFASVFEVENIVSGKKKAIKVFEKKPQIDVSIDAILKTMPGILNVENRLVSYHDAAGNGLFKIDVSIMPLGIPLETVLEKMSLTQRIYVAARVLDTVLQTIRKLSSKGLVHSDIKPENILLVGDRFVLADVDAIKRKSDRSRFVGTEFYMSPEHFSDNLNNRYSSYYELALTISKIVFQNSSNSFLDYVRQASHIVSTNRFLTQVNGQKLTQLYSSVLEEVSDKQAAEKLKVIFDFILAASTEDPQQRVEKVHDFMHTRAESFQPSSNLRCQDNFSSSPEKVF